MTAKNALSILKLRRVEGTLLPRTTWFACDKKKIELKAAYA